MKPRCQALALFLLFAALLLAALAPGRALAHAVYVYAWEDGDNICATGYYSPKNMVRGGTVTVLDGEKTLAQGTTDADGSFCFPRPAGPVELTIVLNAGQGHRAQCDFSVAAKNVTPAEENPAADPALSLPAPATSASPSAPSPSSPSSAPSPGSVETQTPSSPLQPPAPPAFSSPAPSSLPPQVPDTGPTARDIFGGLGWIAGIFGIAAWLKSRKKK